MRHSRPRVGILCVMLLLISSYASASSFVLTQARLDWTGFTFTAGGGLVIDSIVFAGVASGSAASTAGGNVNLSQFTTESGVASSSFSDVGGTAAAGASASNGLLTSQSQSTTSGAVIGSYRASSGAATSTAFWLYGHGSGELTVSVPYSLLIQVLAGQPDDDLVAGAASVSLNLGPGAGWNASDSLSWSQAAPLSDTTLTKTGTLTLSKHLIEPTWGPLQSIYADVSTMSLARVPEPPTFLLVGLALIALAAGGSCHGRQRSSKGTTFRTDRAKRSKT